VNVDGNFAARFEQDRQHLWTVAYRLVGSVEDAEDAVQQAWLKASQADLREVRNLTGWLTTVTARECLDLLRARRRRGEVPVADDESPGLEVVAVPRSTQSVEDEMLLAESVGLALLVVLDRLSPAQRVAFVLHDLFAVPFDEVGQVLDRSPAAAKKLASRARTRVTGRGSNQQPIDQRCVAEHLPVVAAFLAAARGGDIPTLLDLLAPGVVRHADPVLIAPGAATEVRGAAAVAEETRHFTARARAGVVALVDGAPGIVIAPAGRLEAVLRLTIEAARVRGVGGGGEPGRLGRNPIPAAQPHPRGPEPQSNPLDSRHLLEDSKTSSVF